MKLLPTTLFLCTLSALTACKDPREDIVSLHFESESLHDGEIAIMKRQGVNLIGVYGEDKDKNRITVSEGLVWTSSDPTLVSLHPLGDVALCIGAKDWFDTVVPEPVPVDGGVDGGLADAALADAAAMFGAFDDDGGIIDGGVVPLPMPFEPRADVTVAYGDVEASVSVAVIVNVAGTWQVFLDGAVDKPFAELTFQQNGRHLADDLSEVTGEISGDQLLLAKGPLSLQGTLRSLNLAEGTYGFGGTWSAVRSLPTATPP